MSIRLSGNIPIDFVTALYPLAILYKSCIISIIIIYNMHIHTHRDTVHVCIPIINEASTNMDVVLTRQDRKKETKMTPNAMSELEKRNDTQ